MSCITNSYGEVVIEISKDVETGVPIAIVPFGGHNDAPVDISAIINADLSNSGYFKTLPEADMLNKPTDASNVVFRSWQILGQEYLVIGNVSPTAGGHDVMFQLFDVSKTEKLMDYKIPASANSLRRVAHQISDMIYEKLTGNKGVFGAKVAYVSSELNGQDNSIYRLQIADVDGFGAKTIVSTKQPIMSPAWSPDGKKIAYVSFENHRAAIFVQTLATGQRTKVSSFAGINGAPAWSPDGSKLALTLSKDGNPNIYTLDVNSGQLVQLTHNTAINTEPTWSPSGDMIVFTSNQSGSPQLYKIPASGGTAQRLTTEGQYNAKASFSPDGSKIAMVHANAGDYRIAVMDLATGSLNVITNGPLDESPSFSTNGAMVLYATRKGNRGVLSAVSVDGRIQQKLDFQSNEARDPAWAP